MYVLRSELSEYDALQGCILGVSRSVGALPLALVFTACREAVAKK
jgi:hypothetical protein